MSNLLHVVYHGRLLPAAWFAIALVAMLLLHRVVPLADLFGTEAAWFGWLAIVAALLFAAAAAWRFRAARTTILPLEESSALVEGGPFALSRNPMYVALTLILLGVWLNLGSLSPLIVPPLFVLVIQERIIKEEERMLEARFGAAYRAYRGRVRRWV